MTSEGRTRWPLVLLLGLCVSLLVGSAVAVAAPSSSGRPWWHEDEAVRVTGAVLAIDGAAEGGRQLTLDGLVTYDPVRAGIGTLAIEVPASVDGMDGARVGDSLDAVIVRHDGTWIARSVDLLVTD